MAKRSRPIDERLIMDIVGRQSDTFPPMQEPPFVAEKSSPARRPDSVGHAAKKPSRLDDPPPAEPESPPDDYSDRFLRPRRVKNRATIGISLATKQDLIAILQRIGNYQMTLVCFIDNILLDHMERYKEQIDKLSK